MMGEMVERTAARMEASTMPPAIGSIFINMVGMASLAEIAGYLIFAAIPKRHVKIPKGATIHAVTIADVLAVGISFAARSG